MSAEHWLGDVGDLRSDPVVDVFVDRANVAAPRVWVIGDQYEVRGGYGNLTVVEGQNNVLTNGAAARMLDGAYRTDPAQYTPLAGPA